MLSLEGLPTNRKGRSLDKRTILTIVSGDKYEKIWKRSEPFFVNYAEKCDAELIVLKGAEYVPSPHWLKFSIYELLKKEFNRIAFIDADILILDVRNQDEFDICNLSGLLIPLNDLPSRLKELKPTQHIIVHCRSGGRSRRATEFLLSQGFTHVQNLRGGIAAWADEIDPKMKKY